MGKDIKSIKTTFWEKDFEDDVFYFFDVFKWD